MAGYRRWSRNCWHETRDSRCAGLLSAVAVSAFAASEPLTLVYWSAIAAGAPGGKTRSSAPAVRRSSIAPRTGRCYTVVKPRLANPFVEEKPEQNGCGRA